ncbi:MAG: hypothetical protein M3040_07850 [Bacteroidota bacterium]|nr:hypothetical protein [Bacteroidota bacterium]
MKTFRLYHAMIFATIFFSALWACSNQISQSKTISQSNEYPATLEKAMKNKRYFLMQSGINLYTVTSLDLDKAKKQMTVTLDKVDSLHLAQFKNAALRSNKRNEGASMQPQINVYLKDSTSYTLDEPHTISVNNVARIELIN